MQMDICDVDNYLTCTECVTTGRTIDFNCAINELPNGCCKVVLASLSGNLIAKDSGDIITIKNDVSEEAPAECRDITLENVKVADDKEIPLDACLESGEFCFAVCGDIADPDDLNSCGDKEVDLYDALKAIDIVLDEIVPLPCQLSGADVPNGLPPDCRERNSEVDIFDILVIIQTVN